MRVGSFTMAPAHTPHAVVTVKNLLPTPYEGTLRVKGPEGWLIVPAEQKVSIPAGGTTRSVFTVQRGTISETNSYAMEARATGAGSTVVHKQEVVCASAPYFKPQIDGKVEEWKDAIPVTFSSGGKKTVISTYWNRRQFAILVAVEEDRLLPWQTGAPQGPCDAVQLAISPQDTATGSSPDRSAERYEFLVAATAAPMQGRWPAKCWQLASPATTLAETQKSRELGSLEAPGVEAAVTRQGNATYYECGIPFKLLDQIRPSEGREFCLSVLVHDPGGTGLRDWGAGAGLWPSERNRLAWSLWPGATWGPEPPFDNKLPWGLCSSKY